MKIQVLCVVVLFAGLSGCVGSDPVRIDASSDAAFQESLKEMRRSLSREEQANLLAALATIQMSDIDFAELVPVSIGEWQIPSEDVHVPVDEWQVLSAQKFNMIDGLTYTEILDLTNRSDVDTKVLK